MFFVYFFSLLCSLCSVLFALLCSLCFVLFSLFSFLCSLFYSLISVISFLNKNKPLLFLCYRILFIPFPSFCSIHLYPFPFPFLILLSCCYCFWSISTYLFIEPWHNDLQTLSENLNKILIKKGKKSEKGKKYEGNKAKRQKNKERRQNNKEKHHN